MEKELPEGWVNTTVDKITDSLEIGGRPKGGADGLDEGIPSISAEHFNYGGKFKFDKLKFINESFFTSLKKGKIRKSDVLIVKDGATTGKSAYIDDSFPFSEAAVNEHTFILRTKDNFIPKLFFYFTLSPEFNNHILNTKGGSTIGGIKTGFINELKIPLPPLPEQKRIVTKLDNLFTHLEVAKQGLEKIPVLLKQFRQAVLTQAVTGKLTEEWRERKELEKWKTMTGSQIFEFITSGSRGWAQYYDNSGEQLFVRITNMSYDTYKLNLSHEKLQFLKLQNTTEGKRTLLKSRDILISITADVGMVSLVEDDFKYEGYVNQHVCLARPIKEINEKYIVYFLMSENGFGQFKELKRGATKAGLTLGDIRILKVDLPPFEEQTEIVRRVEALFSKADAIGAQYKKLKEQIDQLPQAILAKAFRGEV